MADISGNLPSVVLADRFSFVGEALALLLRSKLNVINVVMTIQAFQSEVRSATPAVAIVDLALGGGSLAAIRTLRREGLATRFVVTSDSESAAIANWAMVSGADAFVPKQQRSDTLLKAVATVLQGKRYRSPLPRHHVGDSDVALFEQLTDRQKDVMRCVLRGYSAKRTGEELGLSPRTVESHRYTVMSMFHVHSSYELCARLRPLSILL